MFVFFACDSEDVNDCVQSAGSMVAVPYELAPFEKIRIERNVSLTLEQGPTQKVILETGENLLPEVEVSVVDGVLVVRDNNGCNIFREFGITNVKVTTPDLLEIRNGSSFDVNGVGVLKFPNLRLISNTTGGFEGIRKSGDFKLEVVVESLQVDANGSSGFYISGSAETAVISFLDEVPRFEGPDLIINDLRIFQRSSNHMIVNPLQSIRGQIYGLGDVISLNRPKIVEVEELNSGRLLFQ
ncbi:MAG: head GIN domain-containing protein [Marinirhabdus sp.]|nr:head GIN domain-containing protein [Marinirhabdus sp.]